MHFESLQHRLVGKTDIIGELYILFRMNVTRRDALSLTAAIGASQFTIDINEVRTSINNPGPAWPSKRYTPQNTAAATDLSLSDKPGETWVKHVDDPTPTLPDRELSTPVMADGKLFYTTSRAIVARSNANGSLIWSVENSNRSNVDTSPVVSNGKVITADTNLTAWSADTGDQIWDTGIGGSSDAALNMDNDSIYITTTGRNEMIKAFDIDSGEEQWSVRARNTLRASVAVDDGIVYAVDTKGFVYCIQDGSLEWRSRVEGTVYVSPTVTDDSVIIGGIDFTFTLLDKSSGEIIAVFNEPNRVDLTPIWHNEYCILSNTRGYIITLNLRTGEVVWRRRIAEDLNTGPVIIEDTLVIGASDGTVRGLNPDDGETRWRVNLFETSVIGLIGGNDAVFAVGDDGVLGGAHIEGTLTPRVKIQQLSQSIRDAESVGVPTGQAESRLSAATTSVRNREYDAATKEVEAGMSEFDELLQEVQVARERMDTVRGDATEFENDTPANTSAVIDTLDRGVSEIERGNPNEAIELSKEAEQSLEAMQADHEAANSVTNELEETIQLAESAEVPVYDAPESLREAESKFEGGNFVEAESIAASASEELETRIETVSSIRDRFNQLEELMQDAEDEDIIVAEGDALFSEAVRYYSDQEYTQALDTADDAIQTTEETLGTAREASRLISQAESFSPIQPFAENLAEDSGSEDHLQRAQSEYESANYDAALTEAQNARSAQRRARILVDGGSVVALAGGYVFWKKDGPRKIATYVRSKDQK